MNNEPDAPKRGGMSGLMLAHVVCCGGVLLFVTGAAHAQPAGRGRGTGAGEAQGLGGGYARGVVSGGAGGVGRAGAGQGLCSRRIACLRRGKRGTVRDLRDLIAGSYNM